MAPAACVLAATAFVRALRRDRPYLAVRSACTVVSTDDFSIFSCAGCHPYFFFEDVPVHIFCSFRKKLCSWWARRVLYLPRADGLSEVWSAHILSRSVARLLIFLRTPLKDRISEFRLFYLSFFFESCFWYRNLCLPQDHKGFFSAFSSSSFIVLHFALGMYPF